MSGSPVVSLPPHWQNPRDYCHPRTLSGADLREDSWARAPRLEYLMIRHNIAIHHEHASVSLIKCLLCMAPESTAASSMVASEHEQPERSYDVNAQDHTHSVYTSNVPLTNTVASAPSSTFICIQSCSCLSQCGALKVMRMEERVHSTYHIKGFTDSSTHSLRKDSKDCTILTSQRSELPTNRSVEPTLHAQNGPVRRQKKKRK